MPKVHVVRERADLNAVSVGLVRSRTSAADREATLAAIIRANPGMHGGTVLEPGTVVIIPPDAVAVVVADDPVGTEVDDLILRVRLGIDDLASAAEAGEEKRRVVKSESQKLMSSPAVRRRAEADPRIAGAIEEGRADLRDSDAQAKKGASRFADARDTWNKELDGLVTLLGRNKT